MDSATFERLRTIIYDCSGISLRETKEAMMSARIAKRMRALGLDTHEEYLHFLEHDGGGDEITRFLDVISTNVTSFFREAHHFAFLRDVLKARLQESHTKIRIWSAAVSTGEEALSIAMVAHEVLGAYPVDYKILATDISTQALVKAQQGVYEASQMENVSKQLRGRFFCPVRDCDVLRYRAGDEIMRRIVYRRLNLSRPPFPMTGQLDVVFCRNVMIYFDTEVRNRLVSELYRLLLPGGYLLTGHAESLSSLKTNFACIRPTIYQKQ